jgi:hypothetical protein
MSPRQFTILIHGRPPAARNQLPEPQYVIFVPTQNELIASRPSQDKVITVDTEGSSQLADQIVYLCPR